MPGTALTMPGTAENTDGLLRQYLPRKMDLSEVDQDRLDEIADELNGRPRGILEWMTPSEKSTEFVAPTGQREPGFGTPWCGGSSTSGSGKYLGAA